MNKIRTWFTGLIRPSESSVGGLLFGGEAALIRATASGHPGYQMSWREFAMCFFGLHRDTVTNEKDGHYCGRCSRPNQVDMQAGLI